MTYFGIPGCAISIIDHGRVSSLQFGYSDFDKKEPFTTDTISGIGSCTKSMTAFAALRLAEKKLLDIDMPLPHILTILVFGMTRRPKVSL